MSAQSSPLPKRPDSLSHSGVIIAKTGVLQDSFCSVCACCQLQKEEGLFKELL